MGKSIRLKGGLYWDSTSLWSTLGEKPNITNGDLNDTKVMGTYHIASNYVGSIANVPFDSTMELMVVTFKDAEKVWQTAINDNFQKKERYFNGTSWTDWTLVPHFRSGTEMPSADLGVDGDIYFIKKV